MILSKVEIEKKWQERVRLAEEHVGGISAYCKQAGVSSSALYMWRKKLSLNKRVDAKVENQSAKGSALRPAFVPIQIMAAQIPTESLRKLPDPKWVASVILHLYEGLLGGQS